MRRKIGKLAFESSRTIAVYFLVVLAVVILLSTTAIAGNYTILDLGTLGQPDGALAYGLNDSGQVVGTCDLGPYHSDFDSYNTHAFRTAPNSSMTNLNGASNIGPTIAGYTNYGQGYAYAINASGQAVGYAYPNNTFPTYMFRTTPTGEISATDLGTPEGPSNGVPGGIAYGINASGQVVGLAPTAIGATTYHAFRTTPNTGTDPTADLGTLGGVNSQAQGINTIGQATGFSDLADLTTHAFRTAANGSILPGSDLGTLGGSNSYGYAINSSGQVTGKSQVAGNTSQHAFRTTAAGNVTPAGDLGTLGGTMSEALAINDAGQVVGNSTTAGDPSPTHAFFADSTGTMQDLNNLIPPGSGWILYSATGINNLGQIAGNGNKGAFLLTPAVPEPGSLALLAVGCTGLLARRRVRRAA